MRRPLRRSSSVTGAFSATTSVSKWQQLVGATPLSSDLFRRRASTDHLTAAGARGASKPSVPDLTRPAVSSEDRPYTQEQLPARSASKIFEEAPALDDCRGGSGGRNGDRPSSGAQQVLKVRFPVKMALSPPDGKAAASPQPLLPDSAIGGGGKCVPLDAGSVLSSGEAAAAVGAEAATGANAKRVSPLETGGKEEGNPKLQRERDISKLTRSSSGDSYATASRELKSSAGTDGPRTVRDLKGGVVASEAQVDAVGDRKRGKKKGSDDGVTEKAEPSGEDCCDVIFRAAEPHSLTGVASDEGNEVPVVVVVETSEEETLSPRVGVVDERVTSVVAVVETASEDKGATGIVDTLEREQHIYDPLVSQEDGDTSLSPCPDVPVISPTENMPPAARHTRTLIRDDLFQFGVLGPMSMNEEGDVSGDECKFSTDGEDDGIGKEKDVNELDKQNGGFSGSSKVGGGDSVDEVGVDLTEGCTPTTIAVAASSVADEGVVIEKPVSSDAQDGRLQDISLSNKPDDGVEVKSPEEHSPSVVGSSAEVPVQIESGEASEEYYGDSTARLATPAVNQQEDGPEDVDMTAEMAAVTTKNVGSTLSQTPGNVAVSKGPAEANSATRPTVEFPGSHLVTGVRELVGVAEARIQATQRTKSPFLSTNTASSLQSSSTPLPPKETGGGSYSRDTTHPSCWPPPLMEEVTYCESSAALSKAGVELGNIEDKSPPQVEEVEDSTTIEDISQRVLVAAVATVGATGSGADGDHAVFNERSTEEKEEEIDFLTPRADSPASSVFWPAVGEEGESVEEETPSLPSPSTSPPLPSMELPEILLPLQGVAEEEKMPWGGSVAVSTPSVNEEVTKSTSSSPILPRQSFFKDEGPPAAKPSDSLPVSTAVADVAISFEVERPVVSGEESHRSNTTAQRQAKLLSRSSFKRTAGASQWSANEVGGNENADHQSPAASIGPTQSTQQSGGKRTTTASVAPRARRDTDLTSTLRLTGSTLRHRQAGDPLHPLSPPPLTAQSSPANGLLPNTGAAHFPQLPPPTSSLRLPPPLRVAVSPRTQSVGSSGPREFVGGGDSPGVKSSIEPPVGRQASLSPRLRVHGSPGRRSFASPGPRLLWVSFNSTAVQGNLSVFVGVYISMCP